MKEIFDGKEGYAVSNNHGSSQVMQAIPGNLRCSLVELDDMGL